MKILVTGYKGFIGSNLYRALPSEHTVVGFDWSDFLMLKNMIG